MRSKPFVPKGKCHSAIGYVDVCVCYCTCPLCPQLFLHWEEIQSWLPKDIELLAIGGTRTMKGPSLRVIQVRLEEDKESGSTASRNYLGSVVMAEVLEGADLQEERNTANPGRRKPSQQRWSSWNPYCEPVKSVCLNCLEPSLRVSVALPTVTFTAAHPFSISPVEAIPSPLLSNPARSGGRDLETRDVWTQ